MRSSAYAFGRRLRDERERHGVALESIAATTKINASLFAALERGDLSAWPSGIFRRAFVRAYATAIGVPPEPVVAEFASLFPEDGIVVEAPVVPQAPGELRMTLALDARDVTTAALTRVTIALLEVSLIVAVSFVTTAWGPGIDPWRVCAVLALIYYPLATVFPARSRALAHFRRALALLQSGFQRLRKAPPEVPAADVRDALHLVGRPSPETSAEPSEDFASAGSPLRSASR